MDNAMRDAMNMANFPVIVAKHAQRIEPPTSFGQRYILGRQGLYREVSTPWLHSCALTATPRMPTPFGDVQEVAVLMCGSPPGTLWTDFIQHAREQSPNECAGLMIWNTITNDWRLAIREPKRATPDAVDYKEPQLSDDEVAVLDVHSHGRHGAFFSPQDDEDDRGCIKISAVIGRVDDAAPEVDIRLVCIDTVREVTMVRAQLHLVQEAG